MFLNIIRTGVVPIKKSITKKNFNPLFLFGCVLLTITLAHGSEQSDETKQTGPITRKRSSEDENALAQVNTNSNTFMVPLAVKNEHKKQKTAIDSYGEFYVQPRLYQYQQYKYTQVPTPDTARVIYVEPHSHQYQHSQPAPYIQNHSGHTLQQPSPAPIKTSTVEMNKTFDKLHNALFSEPINHMSLYSIDEYFSIKSEAKALQEYAQKMGIYVNTIALDGKTLANLKEHPSHISFQDAPLLKYLELFSNIKRITLSNMNGITDHGLHYLKYYKLLTTVSIENCFKITDLSLANLLQNPNITSVEIINCKNISPDRNGFFTGDELMNLKKEFILSSEDQELKKTIVTSLLDTYHLTIDHMNQRSVIDPAKHQNPTTLEECFDSIFKDQKYITTIKYFPLEVNFSDILNHQYDPRTLEQRSQLSQQKIENNTLLNLTILYPNISRINLQGSHVTEEGLWHLEKLPNLRYLDTRNSGISIKLQGEYRNKKRILALFDSLNTVEYSESCVNSYFTL